MASVGSMVGSGSGAGGYSAVRITAVRRPETGRYSLVRITVFQRRQFLTIYIKNVIISVTTITKMLFVTIAPNLRCTAFLPLGI